MPLVQPRAPPRMRGCRLRPPTNEDDKGASSGIGWPHMRMCPSERPLAAPSNVAFDDAPTYAWRHMGADRSNWHWQAQANQHSQGTSGGGTVSRPEAARARLILPRSVIDRYRVHAMLHSPPPPSEEEDRSTCAPCAVGRSSLSWWWLDRGQCQWRPVVTAVLHTGPIVLFHPIGASIDGQAPSGRSKARPQSTPTLLCRQEPPPPKPSSSDDWVGIESAGRIDVLSSPKPIDGPTTTDWPAQ